MTTISEIFFVKLIINFLCKVIIIYLHLKAKLPRCLIEILGNNA